MPLPAQVPPPSQVHAWVSVLPEQVAAAHTVPLLYLWHAPAPSQAPVYPQEEGASAAHSLSGSLPAWMGPQAPSEPLPFLARVHAEQVPAHAVSQQTPSAQKPLAHWSFDVQASPSPWPSE